MAKLLPKLPHRKLFIFRKREKRPTLSCLKQLRLSPAITAIISHAQLNTEEFSVNKGTSWTAFVHIQTNFQEPHNETGASPFGSHQSPLHRTSRSLLAGSSPVSMMVGQVFTSTAPAASLDLSSLIKVWVVRMQAALLTCKDENSLKHRGKSMSQQHCPCKS